VVAEKTLIETFIEEQQRLTAVERFAREHDSGELLLPGNRFRDLLPATSPAPGEQYAFEVDLDKCSGCKACVTACHSLNGLDDNETWRDVGLLIEAPKPRRKRSADFQSAVSPASSRLPPQEYGDTGPLGASQAGSAAIQQTASLRYEPGTHGTRSSTATLQHITTACHHCVDPACMNGCPVLAYEKDPITGIVRHLDDQCIGCQYCVLKCPYDVPKYNARLGIVRKCDMCANRLAVGEAPACAQACPNEAIRITKLQMESVTIGFRERDTAFLAGAPDGDYTLPTTQYVSSRRSADGHVRANTSTEQRADLTVRAPSLVAADHAELIPQPAHWPLVFMLVLTQASVGAACASMLPPFAQSRTTLVVMALAFALAGLGSSVFHLGRPLGAWRGFLNFRRSWMSREIVVFGLYFPLLAATALVSWNGRNTESASPPPLNGVRGGNAEESSAQPESSGATTPHPNPLPVEGRGNRNSRALLIRFGVAATASVGLIGVFCSAMIYVDTRRELWCARRTLPLFIATTLVLGAAGALVFLPTNGWLVAALVVLTLSKLAMEVASLRHVTARALTPMRKTALLISRAFQRTAFTRCAVALVGGIGIPVLLSVGALPAPHLIAAVALGVLIVGELCERSLFFRAVVAPKMPGGMAA